LIAIFTILFVPINAQEKKYSANDLNELMAKVWQNCKIDLDNLRSYIFNETEKWNRTFPVVEMDSFDWVWNVKDGYIGPSIDKINGWKISVGKNNIYPRTLTSDLLT
jgi:hypothetical protein